TLHPPKSVTVSIFSCSQSASRSVAEGLGRGSVSVHFSTGVPCQLFFEEPEKLATGQWESIIMHAGQADDVVDVLDRVSDWPAGKRLAWAQKILQTLEGDL